MVVKRVELRDQNKQKMGKGQITRILLGDQMRIVPHAWMVGRPSLVHFTWITNNAIIVIFVDRRKSDILLAETGTSRSSLHGSL